jgi:hypothetical protein
VRVENHAVVLELQIVFDDLWQERGGGKKRRRDKNNNTKNN